MSELDPAPAPGKEVGAGRPGLPVRGDYADTEVWKVENQWEDRNTVAAKQAGIAWPENSGLSWDEKFAAWVGSLEATPAEDGYNTTVLIRTPFNKSLPGPRLDCADIAIMLRVSFAAWYRLPFFMAAGGNPTVYFGHFGVRTARGPAAGYPLFNKAHRDYSGMAPAEYERAWPRDQSLRQLHVAEDTVGFLGPGEGTGAYLDEIHLNKRVARLIQLMQTYLGTRNMVDPNNTFNLVPEALRTGDTLMYRRGTRGTGHTMIVVRRSKNQDGTLEVQDIFGNIPPAQPYLESPQATKWNFMNNEGGGPTTNSDGEIYSRLGGGLKRWRVAKAKNGVWTNTWMNGDEASWIDSTDYARIEARPQQFGALLGEAPYEEKLAGLVGQIQQKRDYLRQFPASCAARERRELLFTDLVQLVRSHDGLSREQIDAKYRKLEDYVFAPLDYQKSKTCCWNSTTAQMGEIILGLAAEEQKDRCVAPTVFKMVDGGYGPFATYAERTGRAAEWRSWRADEECVATGASDAAEAFAATAWCALPSLPAPGTEVTIPPDLGEGAEGDTSDLGT